MYYAVSEYTVPQTWYSLIAEIEGKVYLLEKKNILSDIYRDLSIILNTI